MTRRLLFILAASLALASCSTSKSAQSRPQRLDHAVSVSSGQRQRLVNEARKWIGTPYRHGGATRSGSDCSGFVMALFGDVYGIKLPRSSWQQRDYAIPIETDQVVPGDLLFFATGSQRNRVSHVGVYVGSGLMVHASPSKGITEARITDAYFKKTFHSAGRVAAVK